jgi:histone H3/H4
MVFCSVTCWEVHLPIANHRESWAVEKQAPLSTEAPSPAESPRAEKTGDSQRSTGVRRIVRGASEQPATERVPKEVLIVASRLKDYIRAKSGYKTSERVLDPLSNIVRKVCDEAIRNAQRDGRMTVLDRDIPED